MIFVDFADDPDRNHRLLFQSSRLYRTRVGRYRRAVGYYRTDDYSDKSTTSMFKGGFKTFKNIKIDP